MFWNCENKVWQLPSQRGNMGQALVMSAYNRQAIAPMWEVKTAKLQGDAGAVNAGLSEEERAAKAGLSAALDTAYASSHTQDATAKNHQPLPIFTSGLKVYNNIAHDAPPMLLNAAGVLGAASSLYGLSQALEKGDVTQAFVSGAGAFTQGVQAYVSIAYSGDVILAAAEGGLGDLIGASTAVSEVVPFLNIANDLAHGNVQGAVFQAIGYYIAGPFGSFVGSVLSSIFGGLFGSSPPQPWGSAAAHWDPATGGIRIDAAGVSGGDAQAYNQLASLMGSVNTLAAQHNQVDPNSLLGLIPQRLGSLSYGLAGNVAGNGTRTGFGFDTCKKHSNKRPFHETQRAKRLSKCCHDSFKPLIVPNMGIKNYIKWNQKPAANESTWRRAA